MEIVTSKSKKFYVDEDDFEMVNEAKWHITAVGYVASRAYVKGKSIGQFLLHRVLLGALPNELVDHINGDPLDNRRCNLRIVTRSQNAMNMKKIRGRSRYKGVWFSKQPNHRNKPWQAGIKKDYHKYHIGGFATEQEAAIAYNQKALELFGEFAKLNEV